MTEEVTALAVFETEKVPAQIQKLILKKYPEFVDMEPGDQVEALQFYLEQAGKTTEGVKSRFPKIKLIHAGANSIQLPPEAGEEEGPLVREMEGIILDQYGVKSWWEKEQSEGGTARPDCASLDGISPYTENPKSPSVKDEDGDETAGCITCPMNKWGSSRKGGKGKDCRDQKRLIVALEGHTMPARLSLSPSNIKMLTGYLNDLTDQGAPIGTVVTKFKAVGAESNTGVAYTGLEMSTARTLTMIEALDVKRNYVEPFKDDFRQGVIEADEASGEGRQQPTEAEAATSESAADIMG